MGKFLENLYAGNVDGFTVCDIRNGHYASRLDDKFLSDCDDLMLDLEEEKYWRS